MAKITPTIKMHESFRPASVHFKAVSVVSTLMLTSSAVLARRYETTHKTTAIPSLTKVPLRPFPEEEEERPPQCYTTLQPRTILSTVE